MVECGSNSALAEPCLVIVAHTQSALLGVSGGDRRLQRDIEEQLTMVTQELTSKVCLFLSIPDPQ